MTVCPAEESALRRRTFHKRFLLSSRMVIGCIRVGSFDRFLEESDSDFQEDLGSQEEEADEEEDNGDEDPLGDLP